LIPLNTPVSFRWTVPLKQCINFFPLFAVSLAEYLKNPPPIAIEVDSLVFQNKLKGEVFYSLFFVYNVHEKYCRINLIDVNQNLKTKSTNEPKNLNFMLMHTNTVFCHKPLQFFPFFWVEL
jgi:hypothetical protein